MARDLYLVASRPFSLNSCSWRRPPLINQIKRLAALDRYFAAFETGAMEPSVCNERVQALRTSLEQLEAQQGALRRVARPSISQRFSETS